jgi:hypothetical protein
MRKEHDIVVAKTEERGHLGDLSVDGDVPADSFPRHSTILNSGVGCSSVVTIQCDELITSSARIRTRENIILYLMMMMGSGYVSELRPPAGLLFTPQVIYEHGQPWWNDVDGRKFLCLSPELSSNPTTSHLVASRSNGRREL